MYIFNYLLINVLGIISYVSLSGNIFRERPVNHKTNLTNKILFGCGGSITSIVIMHFSFMLPNTFTFIDLRFLILIYVFYNAG
ncbi:MAG: hypothetical protein K0Q49_1664, partial [Haloplasmataceae bacterium]|nr:hypothetical protein [Haloplasmataceae bacterium]